MQTQKNRNVEKKFLAIGEFAFAYNAFKEVAIPANTEKIGEGAFVYAPDLSSIEVDASNAYFTSEGGLLLNKEKTDAFSGIHMWDITILNPECDIEWAMGEEGNKTEAISSSATIHGYENPTAQEYAQKNGNPFAVLSDGECQHDYMEQITVSATCSKKGGKTFTCRKCGDSYTEEMPVTAHKYQSVIKKATVTKDGSIQKECRQCGNIAESSKIARPKTVSLFQSSVSYTGKAQKVPVTVKGSTGKNQR